MRILRPLLVVGIVLLSGCATYGAGINGAITQAKLGDYAAAETSLKKALKPDGQDRLLYFLELASIKQLAGDYEASNELLEQAERIAEDLETQRLSDSLLVLMSNPRKGSYGGADFEKTFINYFKALNYFALAQASDTPNQRRQALDDVRVEASRLLLHINAVIERRGTYTIEDEKDQTFTNIISLFSKLLVGNLVDIDSLKYREDALAYYLTGISFESTAEFDNARISYEKAAQAYERGYAHQYRLDPEITEQAWFDTVRMMRAAGGYEREWPALAQKKLSTARRQELDQWSRDKAQIIVLEHKGLAPHREEMNLILSLNQDLHAFQLRPLFELDNEDGLAWFYLLYADKGIAGVLTGFIDAKNYGVMTYGFTKTIPLGPLWHEAERIGLLSAMDPALRVAVPYYRPVAPLPESIVRFNGHEYPLLKAANPALIAIQEQMVSASSDINQAFARAALKAVLADQVGRVGGEYGGLLSIAAKVAFQFTEAAETRNWLLLPQDIRLRRLVMPAGRQQLSLDSRFNVGMHQQQLDVDLQPRQIYLWQTRTLTGLK